MIHSQMKTAKLFNFFKFIISKRENGNPSAAVILR